MNKLTEKEQRVAVDFLEQLIIITGYKNDNEKAEDKLFKIIDLIKNMYVKYEIKNDPFTNFPCTNNEYYKNIKEYEGQIADLKYGHRDMLE